jgi:hypothetical protein
MIDCIALFLSGVYELPFGHGRLIGRDVNRGLNVLIAGWEYNFIGSIQSGTRVDLPGWIRVPTRPQWDMSLNKRVYFTERYNFQVRLETFNVFNSRLCAPVRSPTRRAATSA